MAGAPWAEPEAVRLEASLPFRFQGEPCQGLAGAVPHGGDAERPLLHSAGFGDPDPPDRLGFGGHRQGVGQGEPLAGWQVLHPIHPGGLLAPVVLRDAPHRQASPGPGRHQEPFESVDSLDIAATGGSVDPLLELEHLPLEALPGQAVPFIHWRGRRAHDVLTPPRGPTILLPWSPSAYPEHYLGPSLLRPSRPPRRMRLAPAPRSTALESAGGVTSFLPLVLRHWRVALSTGRLRGECRPGLQLPTHDPSPVGASLSALWLGVPDDGSCVRSTASRCRSAVSLRTDYPS